MKKKKTSKSFIAKEITIGFFVTLLATLIGCYLVIEFFSKEAIEITWQKIQEQNKYSQVITLGTIANFLVFYVFLKKKQIYRARGVLLETFLIAFLVMFLFYKFE